MDFQHALASSAIAQYVCIFLGYVMLFLEKRDKGEYPWKEFGKFVIYGSVLGLIAFFLALFHVNGW